MKTVRAEPLQASQLRRHKPSALSPLQPTASANGAAGTLSTEQRIQILEAAVVSRNVSRQFQTGLVDQVFGGLTA
jgi:hypothetical protein